MTSTRKAADGSYRLIVWHPDVHHRFGEQLYYFEIKPDIYNNWFKITLEDTLRSCDVHGWCLYDIYGFFDALVRAWMTPEQRKCFMHALKATGSVLEIKDFQAHEIDYLWSPTQQKTPNLDEKLFNKHSTDKLIRVQGKDGDETTSHNLQTQGIVLKDLLVHSDKSFQGIKFFMKLQYSTSIVAYQSGIYEELKACVCNFPSVLKELTIYSGSGFCQFLIKGTCNFDNLYNISEFAIELISRFKALKMKSDTLIVATRRSFESDNVNFKNLSFSEIVGAISDFKLNKDKINELSKFEVRLLQDNFEKLQELDLLQDYHDLFSHLFNAYVNRDPDSIKRNLLIIIEFENLFREFSMKFMAKQYGKDWIKTDFGRITTSLAMVHNKIEKLSLYDWLSILGKADSESREITGILGNQWDPILRKTATIRNQVAHARLEDPLSMWSEFIDFFCDFLPIHSAIKKWSIRDSSSCGDANRRFHSDAPNDGA